MLSELFKMPIINAIVNQVYKGLKTAKTRKHF